MKEGEGLGPDHHTSNSLFSSRGATPPPCNVSAEGGTRWRLQYDVYQHFLPENDLSEQSLFTGIHAVADVSGAVKNSKWVSSSQLDQDHIYKYINMNIYI